LEFGSYHDQMDYVCRKIDKPAAYKGVALLSIGLLVLFSMTVVVHKT
jgi:hypothetical protein